MPENILEPREVWDAAEEQIDLWQEERHRKERIQWRIVSSF